MIKIYTSPTSSSCQKATKWLIKYNIPFKEILWQRDGMSLKEFYNILSLTENGVADIVSVQSRAYIEIENNFVNKSLKEVYLHMLTNKSLLRTPLILDNTHLQVGFNSEEIRKFIPRNMRKVQYSIRTENLAEDSY